MRRNNLEAYVGGAAIVAAVGLPLLALIPFGWFWLWQNGYAFYWLGGALVVSVVAFGLRLWAISRIRKRLSEGKLGAGAALGSAEADDAVVFASPREEAAWNAVEELAGTADPAVLKSRDDLIALGVTTVETVAKHMRPDHANPTWEFTMPEALTLIERVSQNLRVVFADKIPLGDQLTVGQVMRVYEWRSMVGVAEKAYDLWRIVRILNPVAATAQEIRERLSKAAMEGLREELAKRLAAAYVREVGRAAIDLYSGRLRVSDEVLAGHISAATEADRAAAGKDQKVLAEPLRILIAGQTSAGKSSLINALAKDVKAAVDALPATADFRAYEIQTGDLPPVMLIDSPGLVSSGDFKRLSAKAAQCDLVIWVAAANRADRDLDFKALDALREVFKQDTGRRPPAVLLVLTHVDRLRPVAEWQPPYDLADDNSAKARSIRDAIAAAGEDLGLKEPQIVPVSLADSSRPYNIEQVWLQLTSVLPDAKSAQLLRCLEGAHKGVEIGKVFKQALEAGKLSAGLLWGKKPSNRA